MTFCTVICPLHTGIGRGFFVANCLPQLTDRHDASTTLYTVRLTKTATAKLFLHALQSDKIAFFPRFVFDFLHVSLPLHTGVGRGFFVAN